MTSPHGVVRIEVVEPPTEPSGGTRRAPENYRLKVSEQGIDIDAASPAGAFYGTRTLRQLLPPDLLRAAPVQAPVPGRVVRVGPVTVDGIEIEDGPRFAWRGVHLDVARHFFPKSFVLKLVDLISLHKFNVLHLHLTDDQGWRVQIDRYPLLTEVGAWRRESPAGHYREGRSDGTPHGGFYTKQDLAEIVAYAARRFVTVVPEIDMPGHMLAAIAAYPELGNTGRQFEVYTRWGISEHVLNLEETTVQFCASVLGELTEIFPGPYIHMGGDECPTVEWEESPRARQLSGSLGFTRPNQLQSWFSRRMADVLSDGGRVMVGWQEILEAGAPEGAIVMVWQREGAFRTATEAAEAGHDIVMAPETWTYFDLSYADDPREPLAIRPSISVADVYGFEPVPAGLRPGLEYRVLGTQCQLWTEYVPTPDHAEYMYFPRVSAFAEVAWSPRERQWEEFESRLVPHLARLHALGVNYRPLDGPTPGQSRIWSTPPRPST